MKFLYFAAALAVASLFWALQPPAPFSFGDQASRVARLAADLGERDRSMDLVVVDGSHQGTIIDEPQRFSLFYRLRSRTRRRLFGPPPSDPSSQVATFVKAAAARPRTLTLTHPGGPWGVDDLEKAISEALAAGRKQKLKMNVLAQGLTAAPALKAIQKLAPAAHGEPLVWRFVALGMNQPAFQAADPVYFRNIEPTKNIGEWINVWRDPNGRVTKFPVEVLAPGREGIIYQGEYAIPGALGLAGGAGNIRVDEFMKFLDALITALEGANEILGKWAQEAADREAGALAKKPQTTKSHDGYYHTPGSAKSAPSDAAVGPAEEEIPAVAPAPGAAGGPAVDSLSLISGGGAAVEGQGVTVESRSGCPVLTNAQFAGFEMGRRAKAICRAMRQDLGACTGATLEKLVERCSLAGMGWYDNSLDGCGSGKASAKKPAFGGHGAQDMFCSARLPVWCCERTGQSW